MTKGGRELLRSFFVEGALLKVVALLASVVLFFAIRSEKDAAIGVTARVIYTIPPDRVLVSDPPHEVRLSLRGTLDRAARLDERDLQPLRADVSSAKHDVDLVFTEDMIKLPLGLRLASITPSTVRLRFEPKVVRSVPITAILDGEPQAGFRVARTEVHPAHVKLSGAKSVVESVQRARTRPFRITDGKDVMQGEVSLEPPPLLSEWEGGGTVTVEAVIVQMLSEKTIRGASIVVTGASRLDAHVEPSAAEIVLRGPAAALAKVTAGSPSLIVDAQAEDGKAPGAHRKRISVVNLPQGVAAEVRPEEVTLVTRRRRE